MSLPVATPIGLRPWQQTALTAMDQWSGGSFLISAAPGAGKTRPSIEIARRMLRSGAARRVVLVCPTTPLTRQWALAAGRQGLHLEPDSAGPKPPHDFHGVAVTYARVGSDPEAWARAMTPDTLVIADEAHHLGEELAWGDGFSTAFKRAKRWLLLSGTPFRSDATPIPGVLYDRDGVCVPNVSYSYADAVRDGVCRPVSFVTYDGTLSWQSGDDVIESTFDTVLTPREASRRYRTAISTELPDGLPRILREAHERLLALRAGDHKDAGALAIAADGGHAKRIAKHLHEITGRAPLVVLHTEASAAKKLQAFTESRDPWIVAVNMVSEGVDIPRLRVGVYATAAKTPLIFRQIVGRFVRTIPGRPVEASWLYLPADPLLRDHASKVNTELRHVLRLRTGEEDGEWDPEPRERKDRDDSEPPEWVPVSADVIPQLSLFGAPAVEATTTITTPVPAPSPTPPRPGIAASFPTPGAQRADDATPGLPLTPDAKRPDDAASDPPPIPGAQRADVAASDPFPTAVPPPRRAAARAPDDEDERPDPRTRRSSLTPFERRALLRDKRHNLVSELRRRDGRSQREINAWLNRQVGITRVDDATLAQLERSIALLLDELTGARR